MSHSPWVAWRREGGSAPKRVGFGGPVEGKDDLHLLRKSRSGACECATGEAMGRSEPPLEGVANGVKVPITFMFMSEI